MIHNNYLNISDSYYMYVDVNDTHNNYVNISDTICM